MKITSELNSDYRNANGFVKKFENFISYASFNGILSKSKDCTVLKEILLFDHKYSSIEILKPNYNQDLSTEEKNVNNNNCESILTNIQIIGNSSNTGNSNENSSNTETGLIMSQDGDLLVRSVYFYNFPSLQSYAIRGPFENEKCK